MPRTPVGISTDHFTPLVQEAWEAFGTDLRYGIEMAARATVVLAKRATWTARRYVREAEAAARTACEAAGTFSCESTAPCGTTTACRWSTGALRDLVVPTGPQRSGTQVSRPQPGPDGQPTSYNLEVAVAAYRDQQAGSLRLA